MKCKNRCISFLDRCWEQYVEKGLTNLPESPDSLDVENQASTESPDSLDVENQASVNFLVPIFRYSLLPLVCLIICIILYLGSKCHPSPDAACPEPNSRQDVANNDLLDNQNRANRAQPTLIEMEPTVPSGSLTVPVRSTNIQVSQDHHG